jgi:hypothetical protein
LAHLLIGALTELPFLSRTRTTSPPPAAKSPRTSCNCFRAFVSTIEKASLKRFARVLSPGYD